MGEKDAGTVPLNHLADLGLPFSHTEVSCLRLHLSAQPRQTGLGSVPKSYPQTKHSGKTWVEDG